MNGMGLEARSYGARGFTTFLAVGALRFGSGQTGPDQPYLWGRACAGHCPAILRDLPASGWEDPAPRA